MDFQTFRKARFAKLLSDAFVSDTRTNGESFVRLGDDSPDWMSDVIHACHGDMMPDDMRYRMIREVCDYLHDSDPDEWEDNAHETADSLVDVYNNARLAWLSSHLSRASYIDQAREEGLIAEDADTFDRIGIGQYQEYAEIIAQMIRAIEDLCDSEDPTKEEFSAWCDAHQFMKPQVIADDYYSVETLTGTEFVPAHLVYAPTVADDMRDYLTGEPADIDEPATRKSGYLARMSAPGYMDCTDWTAHDSEEDAWQYLIDNYAD